MKKLFKTLMIVALCGAAIGMVSCNKDDENQNNNNSNTSGITPGEWIDLGLPSGLQWRAYNIGSSAPEEYGEYYAWGEISPKNSYYWSNYIYANPGYVSDGHGGYNYTMNITKYCNDAREGYNYYEDTLTVLEPCDDVATVTLGDGARMPTSDEWEELINNTTQDEFTLNGVEGYKLTAANGKSIFLPAAGYKSGERLILTDGVEGRPIGAYWSSSYYYAEDAYALYASYAYPLQYGNAVCILQAG